MKFAVFAFLFAALPASVLAHDGHPDALASATEAIHYLSPTHLLPMIIVFALGIGIGLVLRRIQDLKSDN